MLEQVYAATWKELAAHADEFEDKQLRLTVVEELPPQNYRMLEVMRRIVERDKDRPLTAGDDTQKLLREARAGGMYGYEPTEQVLCADVLWR